MSRKRDALGRFSAGAGGTALSQFGREDTRFKRPRTVQPNMPGYPGSVGAMSSAGQAPPTAAQLSVGYSSGVPDISSNSTSSVPVQARPWSAKCCIGDFSPGALLFVRKKVDANVPYKSVADLATANWLLREARDSLAIVGPSADMDMGACSNDHKQKGWLGEQGWRYLGSLRNSMKPPGGLVTLLNVDTLGRTKCGNIWSKKLCTGMRVGLALVPFNLKRYRQLSGPGTKTNNPSAYVLTLNDDDTASREASANSMITRLADELLSAPYDGNPYSGSKLTGVGSYTVYQWMPTVNGELADHVLKFFEVDSKKGVLGPDGEELHFIDHISIGCVSNALHSGKCVESHMIRALQSTSAYTTLPQIELLIE